MHEDREPEPHAPALAAWKPPWRAQPDDPVGCVKDAAGNTVALVMPPRHAGLSDDEVRRASHAAAGLIAAAVNAFSPGGQPCPSPGSAT